MELIELQVEMSDTELLVVPWEGCSYKKLCKELSFKKILVAPKLEKLAEKLAIWA